MTFYAKRYLSLLILLFLFGRLTQVDAQVTVSSPDIRCVSVDSAGDVTLTWVIPNNLDNSWLNYTIRYSGNLTGNYTYTIITNSAQTSVTIPSASLPVSANVSRIYFYIYDSTKTGNSIALDTVSSINLAITNPGTGVAQLYWNAIHTPLVSGSSKLYMIYREYNYVWTLIGSTQNLSYIDTITYCNAFLNYKVEIADSTICISSSNRAGSSSAFVNRIAPPQVIMDTVSVTSNNTVDITWIKSSKTNVIGYIIYQYIVVSGTGIYVPIDTIHGINSTFFNYTAGNPSDSGFSFEVAALDSCGQKGAISPAQNTLFLKETPNSCAETNTLSWNSYANLAGSVGGYLVYFSTNGGSTYHELGTTAPGVTTFLDSNLNTTENRCYYVSVYAAADTEITASSNRVCYLISAPAKPKNNYLTTATVIFNTRQVNIAAYIDSSSRAGFYEFQRSTDSTAGFVSIDTMPAPLHTDNINYIDNSADPATQSYFYRIISQDDCYKSIDTTNLGQTILLSATGEADRDNVLTWNDYRDWYAGPAYYLVYRSVDGVNYNLISTVTYSHAGQNALSDNVDTVTTGQGILYYYIKAVEYNGAGVYPFTDTSYSNIAEAYQNPVVYIPNAFTPNGGINKIFIPVGVFIGAKGYDFSIFNRWGSLIFESTNPDIGWDGKDNGSKVVQEGEYFYLLTYTSSKGEYFQRKGSVLLLK